MVRGTIAVDAAVGAGACAALSRQTAGGWLLVRVENALALGGAAAVGAIVEAGLIDNAGAGGTTEGVAVTNLTGLSALAAGG